MPTSRILWLILLLVLASVEAPAQCRPLAAGPCAIDLHGEGAPRLSASCSAEPWNEHVNFELPDRFADGNADGWHEVVLAVDVDPARGCGCVTFRAFFEGEPTWHTINIGDSPTNDGFGGDAWTTRFDAELMVVQRDLTIYGAEQPGSPSESEVFGLRNLPLADRLLEFEVCDQSVRFAIDPDDANSALHGFINTYRSRELLAIRAATGATESPTEDAPDARIYAAFNRVIHHRAGRPVRDRFGSGVRRVEISLTP